MADIVQVKQFFNSNSRVGYHLTGFCDATGENAGVIKVDKSTLVVRNAANTADIEPVSLDLEAARWNIQGWTCVRLMWDHDTDEDILVVSGSGSDDWVVSNAVPNYNSPYGLQDGRGAGGTGDILLLTVGTPTAGFSYDITLWFRKRQD